MIASQENPREANGKQFEIKRSKSSDRIKGKCIKPIISLYVISYHKRVTGGEKVSFTKVTKL